MSNIGALPSSPINNNAVHIVQQCRIREEATETHTKVLFSKFPCSHQLLYHSFTHITPSARKSVTQTFVYKLAQAYWTSTHHEEPSVLPDGEKISPVTFEMRLAISLSTHIFLQHILYIYRTSLKNVVSLQPSPPFSIFFFYDTRCPHLRPEINLSTPAFSGDFYSS